MSDPVEVDLIGLPLDGGGYPDGVEIGLSLELSDESATVAGEVSAGRYVLHVGDSDLYEGAAGALPLQLAMLTSLGPRPHPSDAAPVLLADGLASLDRAGVLSAWSEEDRAGTPLAHPEVAVWFAWATWNAVDGRAARLVGVADAGGAGIALLDISDDGVLVRPATPTQIWAQLARLLPTPDDLVPNNTVRAS